MKWHLRKSRKAPTAREQLEQLRKSRRFRGVQVHRCGCRASSQLAGIIFPFNQAPKLPIDGCDAKQCSCQYLGVTTLRRGIDRRSSNDRRSNERLTIDRRSGRDRRKGNDVWKGVDR